MAFDKIVSFALSEFFIGVMSNFDRGDAVCAVFLLLSKAFESVDRKYASTN